MCFKKLGSPSVIGKIFRFDKSGRVGAHAGRAVSHLIENVIVRGACIVEECCGLKGQHTMR